MSGIDRREVARNWSARGFGCEWWVDPPGQRWEDFVHPTDELVMLVEGDMEFVIEDDVRTLAPGEELLIPAGTRHSVRNVGSTTARWLYGYKTLD